ncbi:MAG TPA: molybdopterin-dependent oxidoreductase, partial [Gemmataceae bacterium]|nr:molybdopterin-dependent oxidoreductase [Gemmataceae bacterium]
MNPHGFPVEALPSPTRPLSRRQWLRWATLLGGAGIAMPGCSRRIVEAPAEVEPYMRFPGKVAMRVISDRAPCLETPWRFYREDLTPNEAFYVRWHLEAIPTTVDVRTWRLKIDGHVNRPRQLSLAELRRMKAVSVLAVNQCSGNSRSRFEPHMPGAQWGDGAMGNARWTGVRVRDLLELAGLKAKAKQVTFDGLDEGPLPSVPDFVKALDVEHAQEPEPLVAYEMNGEPLPLLNGFPVRLVVPGWYATYWVKALTIITVLPHEYTGHWMAKAYKIPANSDASESPTKLAKDTVPINRMNVRSFFVRPEREEEVPSGKSYPLEGIAFDGGRGIQQVEFSTDGGKTWTEARLGEDLGNYSFRRWRVRVYRPADLRPSLVLDCRPMMTVQRDTAPRCLPCPTEPRGADCHG